MARDEIEKILRKLEELNICIKSTVTKLDGHITCSNEHWQMTEAHMTEMKPVIEFLQTVGGLNKFLKWGGITFAGLLGLIYWVIKKT